ncbi:distal membrane-arm assembly complex protein 2 [Palaemon carinicauda]|uniref:distal membrane-arm assembly complex protein 2 n=1 Tax=Palaemon carinicauda TaxID=392227 RepID=UPI0035B665FC
MSVNPIRHHLMKNASKITRSNFRRNIYTSVIDMKEKEKWTQHEEKWDRPKEEWNSFFHYFAPKKGISVEVIRTLQMPIDFSPKKVKKWYENLKERKAIIDQRYIEERVTAVGCELAAAHFIVHRGGKILKRGSSEWIERDEDMEYDLPRHFTPGFYVECIDASGFQLRYEGLETIGNLEYLKWLDVSNSEYIDDWCIDRICGQYANTLEYLNLSNCTGISERGFSALARLKKLKTLDVSGLDSIDNVKFLCVLLEDVIPDINIIGIDYMEFPTLEEKQI